MPSNPGYFAKYYEQNRDKLNEARKERYHSDPAYRERVLESSRKSRREKRKKHGGGVSVRRNLPMTLEAGDGTTVVLFSAGALAQYLDRSIQSLAQWERRGILPRTPYRTPRGTRHYTLEMMEAVKVALDGRLRLYPFDPDIPKTVEKKWVELGVPMGVEGMEEALKKTVGKSGGGAAKRK